MIKPSAIKFLKKIIFGEGPVNGIDVQAAGPGAVVIRDLRSKRNFSVGVDYRDAFTEVETSILFEIKTRRDWDRIEWDQSGLDRAEIEKIMADRLKNPRITVKFR